MRAIALLIAALLSAGVSVAQTKSTTMGKKVLVAYFSNTGKTKAKAEAIAKAIGADIYEITPAQAYTSGDLDWRNKSSRSSKEMNDASARPPLGGAKIDASKYDVVLLGYPIWWDQCPRPVNTWIESQGLKGKVVVPFATSGGSRLGPSQQALQRLYPDIEWKTGKLLNGSSSEAAQFGQQALSL